MYFHDLVIFEDWDSNVHALESRIGPLSERLKEALELARKHHDQPRMYTKGNYNRHPLRVARILAEELNIVDEKSLLIALCHDLGEWSDYDIENLKDTFGEQIYEGVSALTWDQKGEWSDFVERIVNSNIENIIAIKIADKLDNNRAIALSGDSESKQKAKDKTEQTILPLVEKYYPKMKGAYEDSLASLG
jgi:GTP diphosphokinase / guanosine-3',5'-bis(diphosphate) 3'-diphosphatase